MSDGKHFKELPRWEEMDFGKNCTVWGNFLSSFYRRDPWQPEYTSFGSYDQTIVLFVESCPDGTLYTGELGEMTEEEQNAKISEWYAWNLYESMDDNGIFTIINKTDPFTIKLFYEPIEKCVDEYCNAMEFTGNPDLTGIGVYASYYVEAILATLYLIGLTIWFVGERRREKEKKRNRQAAPGEAGDGGDTEGSPKSRRLSKLNLGKRTLDAFSGTLNAFLEATMIFSVAMLSAAIYISVEGIKVRRTPEGQQLLQSDALYDMILSMTAAGFSAFPVLVLYPLVGRLNGRRGNRTRSHRTWLRRAVVGIIWVLLVAETFLSPRGNFDYDFRHDKEQLESSDEDPCYERGGRKYWQSMKAAQVLAIGLPILWTVVTFFLIKGRYIRDQSRKKIESESAKQRMEELGPWVKRLQVIWDLAFSWACIVFTWGILIYFSILRHQIREKSKMVDDLNEWSFGQILALVTWVPIVMEYLYVFIWGLEDSINTRLPPGLEVHYVNLSHREDALTVQQWAT